MMSSMKGTGGLPEVILFESVTDWTGQWTESAAETTKVYVYESGSVVAGDLQIKNDAAGSETLLASLIVSNRAGFDINRDVYVDLDTDAFFGVADVDVVHNDSGTHTGGAAQSTVIEANASSSYSEQSFTPTTNTRLLFNGGPQAPNDYFQLTYVKVYHKAGV